MKAVKIIACLVAALALYGGLADSAFAAEAQYKEVKATGFRYQVEGDVVPGEWTSQYTDVIKKATEEGIPIVAFFAKSTCGRCKALERNILASETFATWAKQRGYLLLFGLLGEGEASKTLKLIQKGTSLPFCGVWWDKDGDGKPEVGNPSKTSWTGSGAKSEVTFMNNADKWLGEYQPPVTFAGGSFDFEETETDRMECDSSTKTVSFTLTRDEKAAGVAAEAFLTAKGPDGDGIARQTISWEEGESSKTVTVDVSGAKFSKDGDQVTIVLADEDGVEWASNHVTYVVKENSPENPLWIGERAAPKSGAKLRASVVPELAYGEWTMDLVAAKALAASAAGDAFTLVSIAGSLWCPDCANTEKNFLDVKDAKGNNRFSEWAKANNVALAAIDVRRFDTNSVETTANRGNSTLLSRTPGSNGKSGRGYLTRKGVSDEEAAATLERNRQLVTTMTADGGFHRPEDANAYRTGVPYFVMLRKDGSVAARFTRYAKAGATASDSWDDVIKRFDEMLAIAGKGATAHADAAEIENNHAATTTLEIEANGGEAGGEISCTDLRDAYRLANFAGNATLAIALKGSSAAQVELSLWQVRNGEAAMVDGAFRTGQLAQGLQLEYTFAEAGDFFVQVAAKNRDPDAELDAEFSHLNTAAMNFISYTLSSSAIYAPGAAPAKAKAPDGSKTVRFSLEVGVLYRFDGLDADANAAVLAPTGMEGFYKAKQSGRIDLVAAEEGGVIEYQTWEPGVVGFEPDAESKTNEVTCSESKAVTVAYRRTAGISGDVTVKVSLNKDETDFYYDYDPDEPAGEFLFPRFTVNGVSDFDSTNVTWRNGQPLEECVGTLLVQAADSEVGLISKYFGPGKVVFDIEIVDQTDAGDAGMVVDNAKFTINFEEDQEPSAGTAAVIDAVNDAGEGWVDGQTLYARQDGEAVVTLGRLYADEGPVYATLDKSVGTVTLGGDYDEVLGVFWSNHDNDPKTVTVTNLPAAGKSVKLTLKASPLSPDLKVLKSSSTVTIVSVAATAPSFSAPAYDDTVYRYVAVSNVYPVVCEDGDKLSFTMVSGSLPKGLKAVADSSGKALVVSGTPTGDDKAGKAYTAVFQVTATRGKSKVAGLTTTVGITVKDPAAAGSGVDGKALNDSCAVTKKLGGAMVFALSESGEYAELVGMLTGLTLPAKGNASAKFECAEGSISLSSKNWSGIDGDSASATYGQLTATLVGSGKNSAWSMDVEVGTNGAVMAVLSNGAVEYEDISFAGAEWSASRSAESWKGYYTATLPVATKPDGSLHIVEGRAGVASRAAAYLTFTMSKKADWDKGLVKWAGMLPNGEKVSGSSTLVAAGDGSHVYLPYVSFNKKDSFAGVAKIGNGAESEEQSCYETVEVPEIDFGDGAVKVLSVLSHTENNKATTNGDYVVRYDMYGGIYDLSDGLDCCCIAGRGTDVMKLVATQPEAPSDEFGAFGDLDALDVKIGEKTITLPSGGGSQKLTLKFDAKTGVVSGKFKLSYTAAGKAKTVAAAYYGAVQLGFGDSCGCEENPKPFVSGFWTFADKLSYQKAGGKSAKLKVKRGAKLEIDVAQ